MLVTVGCGWYQEWDKEAQELHMGYVAAIPVGAKRWHEAAKDSWIAHIAIEVPGENTSNEWLKPVERGTDPELMIILQRFTNAPRILGFRQHSMESI